MAPSLPRRDADRRRRRRARDRPPSVTAVVTLDGTPRVLGGAPMVLHGLARGQQPGGRLTVVPGTAVRCRSATAIDVAPAAALDAAGTAAGADRARTRRRGAGGRRLVLPARARRLHAAPRARRPRLRGPRRLPVAVGR